MKMLENIWIFFTKNKKNIAYTLFFLILFFFFNDFAFADSPTQAIPTEPPKQPNWVIDLVQWVLLIASSLIWVVSMLIWLFLRPEWTSGSVIWLDTQLKTIWIMISNVVYFVFAWIFITIAFMNIVWWWDSYQLKTAIPKFIIWVLIVPFSWFFVQFILSLSSILTVAVLSLPFDTFPQISTKTIELCKDNAYKYDINASGSTNFISCKNGTSTPITIDNFLKNKDNGWLYQIMMIYTYWVMRIHEKWLFTQKEVSKVTWIKTLFSLWLKWVFDVLFLIVYWILMIALFLAFMTRWFALWFYAMFSPIFWLLYYLWKWWKEWLGNGASKNFNLHEFIALAFVPVYVAAALAFWLLFLFTAWEWFSKTTWSPPPLVNFKGDVFTVQWWSIDLWPVVSEKVAKIGAPSQQELFAWFDWSVWAMVLELLWLAVMWMAVMTALHSSTITASVTDPIQQFGNSIWELIKKAPTYAPILPGGMSAQGLQQIWGQANTYFQNKSSDNARSFMKEHGLFQSTDNDKSNKSDTLARNIQNSNNTQDWKNWMDHARTYKDYNDAKEDPKFKELIIAIWNKVAIKPEDIKLNNLKDFEDTMKLIRSKDIKQVLGIQGINNFWTEFFKWNTISSTSNPIDSTQQVITELPEVAKKVHVDSKKIWKVWIEFQADNDLIISVSDTNAKKITLSGDDFKKITDNDKKLLKDLLKQSWVNDRGDIENILKKIFWNSNDYKSILDELLKP